jgi:glycosyltransferase involved in cell wall biosynthesis
VQLYNTHGSYFSHSALPLLSRLRPIAWRLSDMWALTGHVAYSFDCERWLDGCGSCPYLDVYPALRRDRTALLWRWKQTVYRRSRLHLIAPSRWLEGLARRSPLLSRFPIHLVPNGIDTGTFRPGARPELKRELGLDPERPVVLFSALDVSDPRKGGAELRDALGRLDELDFQLVVMGGQALDLPRPVVSLGRLDEDEAIARAFAAADVYVLPTLAENLPNVALEALACGTPTVAFAAGGVGDAVRHLETGYLAAVGDVDGLAAGIRTLLADAELRGRLGASARAVAEAEYGVDREARDLLAIYEEMRAA